MQLIEIIRAVAGLLAGGVIGLGFGWVQSLALRRNGQRQQKGDLNSGWALMPGSAGRVACLLLALAVVQLLCPLLFINGSRWWVSAGVVAGYGAVLFRRLHWSRSQHLPPA